MDSIKIYLYAVSFLIFQACQNGKETPSSNVYLIPQPVEVKMGSGYFEVNENTHIIILGNQKQVLGVAEYFKTIFQKASGISLALKGTDNNDQKSNSIIFEISDTIYSEEEYALEVNENGILLKAKNAVGLFYGVQTLRQLLPLEINAPTAQLGIKWKIPNVHISDQPRFSWRGMHLDVSRHYFPKEFIKKYIDHLARYKFNKFHWHLTDGPGWRIDIKKYPKLISTASWRVDKLDKSWDWPATEIGKPTNSETAYGGHYSKNDIREIIQYASDRFIEVIPEIEMPGHSYAAMIAYPELACEHNNILIDGLHGKDVFCVSNEKTYAFLEDVLDEVAELFPSKLIHIGGDEVGKQAWKDCSRCQQLMNKEGLKDEKELQSFFIRKMAAYVESLGKEVIGWDEILEGGLAENAKVMSWRGMESGVRAANMGHDVIMAPNTFTYFDLYQGNPELEPDAYSRLLLSKVYQFDPIPTDIDADKRHHILGGHGCLWTENIQTPDQVEYMMFPRLLALSETIWSPKENLNWDTFIDKMEQHQLRLEVANINFARSAYQANIHMQLDRITNHFQVNIENELGRHEIRYTLDGRVPNEQSILYEKPFILKEKAQIRAATFRDGKRYSQISSLDINVNIATGKKVIYQHLYSPQYTAGGESGLVNGIFGTKDIHDGQWQGFEEKDVDVIIDLGESQPISTISTQFIQSPSSWIYLPKQVTVEVSLDGEKYEEVAHFERMSLDTNGVQTYKKQFPIQEARYVRLVGKNIGNRPGRLTEKAWLFIDEIVVELK